MRFVWVFAGWLLQTEVLSTVGHTSPGAPARDGLGGYIPERELLTGGGGAVFARL